MNRLLYAVYDMYDRINIGMNPLCKDCRNATGNRVHVGPIPIFHVGDDFENDTKKYFL